MHDVATETHRVGDACPRSSQAQRSPIVGGASLLALVILALSIATQRTSAQLPPYSAPLSNTEDARTLDKGIVLFRILNAWTRIDQVYDATADSANPLHALGNAFTAESLGARQFPQLAAAQSALRTLTGNANLSLNLGQVFGTADSRFVQTPMSLSYGVSNRITIGVMVPVVQTHTTVLVQLNPSRVLANSGANVGPNPAQLGFPAAVQNNANVISALNAAAQDLANFINNCNSSGSCSPLTVTQATDVRAQVIAFRDAITLLYGTTSAASPFAPLGTAQTDIVTQLRNLEVRVNAVLGGNVSFGNPTPANGIAALSQLRQLVTSPAGAAYDSLASPDRIGVGDVEISALYKLLDGFRDTTGGVRLRGSVRGVLRLGTGRPPSGTIPFEVGTGTGQTSADGAAIFDVRLGSRFVTTLAGQYTAYFTSASIARVPNSDYSLFPVETPVAGSWREGNAIQLEATPRIFIANQFSLNGAYAYRRQGASKYTSPNVTSPPLISASTEQRVGLGFQYSSVARYARSHNTVPFEITFTHLETITASGSLTPKNRRDQIEFRIYDLLRRGR